jgi:lipopolysaccharide/colanic/teichoic acid biosynthesis glycosyltransferase
MAMLLLFVAYKENPIFKQTRVGYLGIPFEMYKLRTFHGGKPSKIGKFLRKTSIDELPQLWNVINGSMTLVGPRPLLADEIPHYGFDAFQSYITVSPGITGLFQIHGRKQLTIHQRSLYDYHYITNKSIRGDLKIIWATIPALLSCKGAY